MISGSMMSGLGMGFGLFGWLMMLLFWILIIVGVVLVIRWFINEGKPIGLQTEETALDVLKKRYARGAIEKEEFEAEKRDIMT